MRVVRSDGSDFPRNGAKEPAKKEPEYTIKFRVEHGYYPSLPEPNPEVFLMSACGEELDRLGWYVLSTARAYGEGDQSYRERILAEMKNPIFKVEDDEYYFFFDTETALIAPGKLAPPLTCLTYCTQTLKTQRASLVNHKEAVQRLRWALEHNALIVGHNVAFDLAVMAAEDSSLLPLIFAAYDNNRVTDTMIRQQLADIADGKFSGYQDSKGIWRKRDYSLSTLSARHLGAPLEKDEWRLRYAEFRDVPIEEWPEGAREYPRKDAEATRDIWVIQEKNYGGEILADQYRQARAYFALHLSSAWGAHTDAEAVNRLRVETEQARDEVLGDLVRAGLVRKDGTRDTKAAKARMVSVVANPRKTASGDVSLDEESCLESGDALLEDYATYSTLNKVLSTDIPMLASASHQPMHTRYGMAETGRTTSGKNRALGGAGGNIQNLRRMPGIRECIVPRKGKVFVQADYHAFELFALAQSCLDLFGQSRLAVALNAGLDPHCVVAATILDKPYGWVVEHKKEHDVDMARQTGKVANFGFPGGLGAPRLVDFAKKGYQVFLTVDQARKLKEQWLAAWPEMRQFFQYVSSRESNYGFSVQLKRSRRWRGNTTYTAACNTLFQGVAADGAKNAAWLITKACYLDESSPLFGSRMIAFVHDEFILESNEEGAPEAAEELSRLMVEGAKWAMPDMNIKAEPCLMARWSKEAKTLRDANGRLMVWK